MNMLLHSCQIESLPSPEIILDICQTEVKCSVKISRINRVYKIGLIVEEEEEHTHTSTL